MSSNDLALPSTVDVVTFRASRVRAFLMMFGVAGAAWFLVRAVCMLLVGGIGLRPTAGDLAALAASTIGYAAPVAGAFVLVTWRRQPWVRVSAGELVLSATGRDVVVLPWSHVQSVALRRYGPLTQLVVTPLNAGSAGTDRPARSTGTARRDRTDRPAGPARTDSPARTASPVVVDVAMLQSSPATLMAEIGRVAASRL